MEKLREKLRGLRDRFRIDQEENPCSLYHLSFAIRWWWAWRPRLVRCGRCDRLMWQNSRPGPGEEVYCSSDCAYSGWRNLSDEDDIPF